MAEHETIADIIAEMRGMGNYQRYSGDYARVLANRLDAAHRRELSKNASKNGADFGQLGESAKLREALKHIKDRLPHMLQYMRVHWEDANAGGYFDELMLVIDAALAAPPRNCDVYNNESCRMAYHLHGDGLMTMQAFADWLFAPATEKEGGAK